MSKNNNCGNIQFIQGTYHLYPKESWLESSPKTAVSPSHPLLLRFSSHPLRSSLKSSPLLFRSCSDI